MTTMKYFKLIILLLMGCLANNLFAQADSYKLFRFIYVAHDDESMGIDNADMLRESLSKIWSNIAYGQEDPSIFYLSNGISYDACKKSWVQGEGDDNRLDTVVIHAGTPIVIKMYIPGDNRNDFETVFLGEIQNTLSHNVNTDVDLANILHILQDADFLDENNQLRYGRVSFEFFIHPRFWEQRLHEKLIAALYFVLDVDKYDIRFNIHHMISDVAKRPTYWKTQKADFGLWNISNINNAYPKVQLMQ